MMDQARSTPLGVFTATGTGTRFSAPQADRTFQATVVGTGAVAATVIFEGSNDGAAYVTLATITLSGTTSASDGVPSTARWPLVRARVTALSGTGAVVTATMGG